MGNQTIRRARLIWFAAGAATTLLISFIAAQIPSAEETKAKIATIELTEPVVEAEELKDEHSIANATGQIARDCGAKFFQTTFLVNDHPATMELPITVENSVAAECVLREATERGIAMRIVFRQPEQID